VSRVSRTEITIGMTVRSITTSTIAFTTGRRRLSRM
jgi:hypothetical protein